MFFRHSDDELLEGLRQKQEYYIDYIYHEYGPVIRHFVRQNSGNAQDVEDITQDTIIKLYQYLHSPSFRLESSLKTFFIAIAKKIWMQRLERKCRLMYQADYQVHEPRVVYSPDDKERDEENLEQQRLFFKHLATMPPECRQLLDLYILKVPYKKIAKLLNFRDDICVKTRKYYCKNLLRKNILNDPDYKKITNYHGPKNYKRIY